VDVPVEVGAGDPSGARPGAGVEVVDHESQVALHMVRRAALAASFVVLALGLWRGPDAALGAAVALAVVAANFRLSAQPDRVWSARQFRPRDVVMGAVLGGYLCASRSSR